MTAPSSDDAGKVYQFLAEYIAAKDYPPSEPEITAAVGWPKWRTKPALVALQQAGKIRLISGGYGSRHSRHSITLTALPTPQITRSTPPAEKASVKPAVPKPGQIICVQCRSPVCEKSKWYCDLHLRLNREATKRIREKKRAAHLCLQCDRPVGPVSLILCEEHRKKGVEAKRRYRTNVL